MLELDAKAEATPWARRHVRDVLSAWQVADERIDTAELAVCELVSNAVRHVAPDAHITLPQGGKVVWCAIALV